MKKKTAKKDASSPKAKVPARIDLARAGEEVPLPAVGNLRAAAHLLERESLLAVNAALDCGRPLLVRGEPGVGKSQLARAVAKVLGRVFISRFIDARTEAHDLMASHDAVTRLAEAQAWGQRGRGDGVGLVGVNVKPAKSKAASRKASAATDDKAESHEGPALELSRHRYLVPGPLWWAFDWAGALRHVTEEAAAKSPLPSYDTTDERIKPEHGVVLLLDEIDKADVSVPNGLLEALGHGELSVPGLAAPVRTTGVPPLVVLTSNDDRVLPDALVRRCVVLWLRVPEPGMDFEQNKAIDPLKDPLVKWLVDRGRAHFGNDPLLRSQYAAAAVQVVTDRLAVQASRHCAPGLAEYIDLLAALRADPARTVADISRFFLYKHIDPGPAHEPVDAALETNRSR